MDGKFYGDLAAGIPRLIIGAFVIGVIIGSGLVVGAYFLLR